MRQPARIFIHQAATGADNAPLVRQTAYIVARGETDVASRTAFFLSKRYVDGVPSVVRSNTAWFAHAVDVDTLVERAGFPLRIEGRASNDPSLTFNAFLPRLSFLPSRRLKMV